MRKIYQCCLFLFGFMNLQADSIKDKKVIIGGAVKNVARFFQDNKNEIERIGALFNDYAVVIYENNSIDATKYVYERWAQENKRVIFLSEDLSEEYLKKYTPLIADFRTQLIARARNKILDVASNHIFDDYDYVIMMDLDDFEPLDLVP